MERICVIVRARPLSAEDAKFSPWKLAGNSIFLGNQSSRFEFDRIFGEGCSTREVYEARTKEIVASAIRGFNGTVFAYGQTNSGKTHTMRGSTKEPGIIPLAVHDLFRSIEENTDREFLVRMSYMEIYNEEINDLLAPEHRRLQIHESLERGIFVAGLREEIVVSPEQIIDLMEFGESHRHVGETNMNVHSSRSHTIFRMIIESRERNDDHGDGDSDNQCDAVRVSVLNLVDLAGSERAAKTGAEGVRLKEGSHINKSLMTLGTVIKKLSEGAESQGGHVPYRDSKLTRILQPALGGNANTAIICNITLAQIHSEETKSSLQFASRAIRVKSFACVNEILTDAALLKRQQKEIEELRAGLLASHSEHWEQEILNLRNTLLQSELEKERIALELEEEKKAKAQREKRLQEQEITIANLSSMVLLDTKRDDKISIAKKSNRRNTWCPVPFASNSVKIACKENAVVAVPFDELVQNDGALMLEVVPEDISCADCSLPDTHALLNITSRRKARRQSSDSPVEKELHTEIEHAEKGSKFFPSMIGIENECIMEESECSPGWSSSVSKSENECTTLRDSEISLVVDQFQESMMNILLEKIQDAAFEVQHSSNTVEEASSFIEELFQSFSSLKNKILNLEALTSQHRAQVKAISYDHEKLYEFMKRKNRELEIEKTVLLQKNSDLDQRIQELIFDKQEKENGMNEMVVQHKLEKDKLLDQINGFRKEVSCLSSSTLAKEKEATWKELEKTKSKLKDTEAKLKNAIQDKVRLESEKAQAGRETKRLQSQKALLERDVSKHESMLRRESKAPDLIKSKCHGGPSNQIRQADYEKLEICAFEMEAEIASLEDKLMAAISEREEVFVKNGFLEDELEALSSKLNTADSELTLLREQIGAMAVRLDECECARQELQDSYDLVSTEKEEMAMQLTEALLEFEADKSAWSASEKAFSESDERSTKEIAVLSENLGKVRDELESCSKQLKVLDEKLSLSEENLLAERESSFAKLSEIARLRSDLEQLEFNGLVFKDVVKSTFEMITSEHHLFFEQVNKLQSQLRSFQEERASHRFEIAAISGQLGDQLASAREEVKELTEKILDIEAKAHQEALTKGIERAKLKRMLGKTQGQLEAYQGRYFEAIDEIDLMNRKYEEASAKLKEKLASYAIEILNLKKQIVATAAD